MIRTSYTDLLMQKLAEDKKPSPVARGIGGGLLGGAIGAPYGLGVGMLMSPKSEVADLAELNSHLLQRSRGGNASPEELRDVLRTLSKNPLLRRVGKGYLIGGAAGTAAGAGLGVLSAKRKAARMAAEAAEKQAAAPSTVKGILSRAARFTTKGTARKFSLTLPSPKKLRLPKPDVTKSKLPNLPSLSKKPVVLK